MKKNELIKSVNRTIGRAGLKLRKNSPAIFVITGVAGMVVGAVAACRATTKLSGVLDDSKEQIDQIHEYVEEKGYSEEYTEDDQKKDLTIVYCRSALKVARLYAPSVAIGLLSAGAIFKGHNILRKRNVALAAAYTTINKSFKDYRGRVAERFGEAVEKELRYNVLKKEYVDTVVNEDGSETTEIKTLDVADPNSYSEFAKFFDDGCIGWEKDPELNLMFLRRQQDHATDLLRKRGYLFLNEVYDMLGIHRTRAGQIVGWIYDEKNPIGDNYVDFGIYDVHKEDKRNFVNGIERTVLLEFNVDGPILDMI